MKSLVLWCAIYNLSRQRYVLGDNAMHKIAKSSVFVSGLGGLGVEIGESSILQHPKRARTMTMNMTMNMIIVSMNVIKVVCPKPTKSIMKHLFSLMHHFSMVIAAISQAQCNLALQNCHHQLGTSHAKPLCALLILGFVLSSTQGLHYWSLACVLCANLEHSMYCLPQLKTHNNDCFFSAKNIILAGVKVRN